MSKLNVNEIEATSTNTNVKVVPKGADATCEIKGDTDDATLQLNCSAQSHGVKLKAPAHSASQNYTMILPDNAPAVTTTEPTNSSLSSAKLLKVKSITGSGSSAVGQLEFTDQPAQDLTTLDAANLTSGTLSTARIPAIPAASGAALELVSKTVVGSTAVTSVSITGLEADAVYKLVGRNIHMSASSQIYIKFLNSAGGAYTSTLNFSRLSYNGTSQQNYFNTNHSQSYIMNNSYNGDSFAFIAEFATKAGANWFIHEGMQPGMVARAHLTFATIHASWQDIRGLQFVPSVSSYTFQPNSEFCLYKYKES
tara:strand:- start:1055 stop:1984 length:930 start_codon:yes stop_codon:yes gene_type:complete